MCVGLKMSWNGFNVENIYTRFLHNVSIKTLSGKDIQSLLLHVWIKLGLDFVWEVPRLTAFYLFSFLTDCMKAGISPKTPILDWPGGWETCGRIAMDIWEAEINVHNQSHFIPKKINGLFVTVSHGHFWSVSREKWPRRTRVNLHPHSYPAMFYFTGNTDKRSCLI